MLNECSFQNSLDTHIHTHTHSCLFCLDALIFCLQLALDLIFLPNPKHLTNHLRRWTAADCKDKQLFFLHSHRVLHLASGEHICITLASTTCRFQKYKTGITIKNRKKHSLIRGRIVIFDMLPDQARDRTTNLPISRKHARSPEPQLPLNLTENLMIWFDREMETNCKQKTGRYQNRLLYQPLHKIPISMQKFCLY